MMRKLKKYDLEWRGPAYLQSQEMVEAEDGLWVEAEEVEALIRVWEAEEKAARAEIAKMMLRIAKADRRIRELERMNESPARPRPSRDDEKGRPMNCEIPDNWVPTAKNVNALPEPLRDYIMRLETKCDPSGDIRTIACLRENNRALAAKLKKLNKPPVPREKKP